VPFVFSDEQCNKAHKKDLKSNFSRHIPATRTPTAPLPADLATLIDRWPALPEHIKSAFAALLATVKL